MNIDWVIFKEGIFSVILIRRCKMALALRFLLFPSFPMCMLHTCDLLSCHSLTRFCSPWTKECWPLCLVLCILLQTFLPFVNFSTTNCTLFHIHFVHYSISFCKLSQHLYIILQSWLLGKMLGHLARWFIIIVISTRRFFSFFPEFKEFWRNSWFVFQFLLFLLFLLSWPICWRRGLPCLSRSWLKWQDIVKVEDTVKVGTRLTTVGEVKRVEVEGVIEQVRW